MDGFGDSFVPTAENGTPAPEVDPAAEFLAREQDQLAGLDDDLVPAAPANGIPTEPSTGFDGEADFFGGDAPPVNGGPDLESFEMLGGDEIARDHAPTTTTTTASPQPLGEDPWVADPSASNPPLQEPFSQPPAEGAEEEGLGFCHPLSSSHSAGIGEEFPPPTSDLADGVAADAVAEAATAPTGDYSGFGNVFGNSTSSSVAAGEPRADSPYYSGLGEAELQDSASYPEPARSPVPTIPREEPEKIKIWREEQRVRLEHKDIAEEENKNELREKAKKELEEWYKQHEEQVAKTRQANRDACKSAEKELVADTGKMEPGTEWERIAKLCDFNPKTAKSSRDISRMRSIILQVKQSPPVKA